GSDTFQPRGAERRGAGQVSRRPWRCPRPELADRAGVWLDDGQLQGAVRFRKGQRNLQVARYRRGKKMLRTLFSATILAGALATSAMAQAPDAGCGLPSEPEGIPAALDAAIPGPADKDRACMKALLIPEPRMMF